VSGIETYSLAPQSMLSAGADQGDDMTKTAYPGNRLDYANLLLGENLHRAMIAGLKSSDRGYKHARQAVLRMLDCPGALVECGYLSNEAEARRVATPEFRQSIAEALAAGIQNYASALATLRPPPPPEK
jgi:N-acetylmuramoyl-L-alanine amidase